MPANPSASTGVTSNQSQLEEIWRSECLLDAMCDPGRFETHIAVTLARQMMALYQGFDTRLVAELIALPDVGAGKDRRVERCLEILDAVSDSRRMVMPLRRLADSVNPRVRSKVARILGRLSNNLAWTWKFREEKDSRTRANMIESQWGNDSPEIREVLWLAVRDTHQRVRGNAILALYRLGVGNVLPALRELAENQTAICRATAAWVMGATGDPRFQGILKTLRQDAEAVVRAAALRALVQLNKSQGPEGQSLVEPLIYFSEDLDGVRRVGFDLPESASRSLLPTEVVLKAGGELIWDYKFIERRSCPLSALFLIFEGNGGDGLAALADGFSACLEHTDTSDRWSVVRIATNPEIECDGLKAVLPLYQGLKLKTAIAQFDTLPRIQVQDLAQAVRVLRSSGPDRHLVLLHTSGALSDAVLGSVEPLARKLNCIVDVISFGKTENERLRKIARQTDGAFLTAPEGPTSAEWMVRAYASLGHRYEVTYPLAAAADSPSDIKIIPPPKMGLIVPRPSPPEMPAA